MRATDAGSRCTEANYTVKDAVTDFLDQGMKGKAKATIDNYRSMAEHNLIPQIGAARLKRLTAGELDKWLDERAQELSTRSLRLIHQILERAIRHAQARDKVRRNVASLVILPEGRDGRPSRALTLDQAVRLLDAVQPGRFSNTCSPHWEPSGNDHGWLPRNGPAERQGRAGRLMPARTTTSTPRPTRPRLSAIRAYRRADWTRTSTRARRAPDRAGLTASARAMIR
jgi:hypothetical protein